MQLVDEENREEIGGNQGIGDHPSFTAIVRSKDRTAITYYHGRLRRSEPYACEDRIADTAPLLPFGTSIGCNKEGSFGAYRDSVLCVSKGHRKEVSRGVASLGFPSKASINGRDD